MHARRLVELAALVTREGPALISTPGQVSCSGLEQYWLSSKCRFERWNRTLKKCESISIPPWDALGGALEEIASGELLTRVWTAIVVAHDRRTQQRDGESIVRSVWMGHLEARRRALSLLVHSNGIETSQAVMVTRYWRRAECWSDFLLGYLLTYWDVSEFAVDPRRAEEFRDDLADRERSSGGRHSWALVQAALQGAFRVGLSLESPSADVNARIAGSVLACFPAEQFDSTGLLRSLWLTRLANGASDVQGMIDDLLGPCDPSTETVKRSSLGARWRS